MSTDHAPNDRPYGMREPARRAAESRRPPGRILVEAFGVIGERRDAYGPPYEMMAAIAARWTLTLGHPVSPAQVVLCMIDLKLARLTRDPAYRDSIVDVAGYAALLPEVLGAQADASEFQVTN